jgi:putative nucleotidyltransferase with HDIG domain
LRAALAEHVPGQTRVFVIDKGSRAARVQAMVLGASRVLERPVTPLHLARAISEILAKRAAERSQHNALLMEEAGSSIALASRQLGAIFASQRGGGRLQVATVQSAAADIADDIANVGFRQWLDTVRRHHEGTFQHCLLVTGVATNFAQAMGMSRADVVTLTTAGMLHDIGKADIPLAILDKPGQLSASERVVMEAHPVVGQEHLLKSSDVPGEILAAVRHHHEMLDGSGYPDRLCGRQIDDITRILTICDIYGALTERRSYKAPMQPEGALNVLETMAQNGKVERALVGALRMAVTR